MDDVTPVEEGAWPLAEPVAAPSLRAAVEAILLVVDEPLDEVTLASVLERPRAEVAEVLQALAAEYTAEERGFDLRSIAGGWRLYTRPECAGVVERFVRDGQQARLTQAALETLAIVAYKQPVVKGDIERLRGVEVDGILRTLLEKNLVRILGRKEIPGRPILYGTTKRFLELFELKDLSSLPSLEEIKALSEDFIEEEAE